MVFVERDPSDHAKGLAFTEWVLIESLFYPCHIRLIIAKSQIASAKFEENQELFDRICQGRLV